MGVLYMAAVRNNLAWSDARTVIKNGDELLHELHWYWWLVSLGGYLLSVLQQIPALQTQSVRCYRIAGAVPLTISGMAFIAATL